MNFQDILQQKGIRPSVQRLQIYQFLMENPIHPTVDTVYTALVPSIPTLSKTTVYNTLKLLEEHDLVQTIIIDDEQLRYDANTSQHYHFKCIKCGNVYDIFLKSPENLPPLPEGFSCKKIQTNIWGTCIHCK